MCGEQHNSSSVPEHQCTPGIAAVKKAFDGDGIGTVPLEQVAESVENHGQARRQGAVGAGANDAALNQPCRLSRST